MRWRRRGEISGSTSVETRKLTGVNFYARLLYDDGGLTVEDAVLRKLVANEFEAKVTKKGKVIGLAIYQQNICISRLMFDHSADVGVGDKVNVSVSVKDANGNPVVLSPVGADEDDELDAEYEAAEREKLRGLIDKLQRQLDLFATPEDEPHRGWINIKPKEEFL